MNPNIRFFVDLDCGDAVHLRDCIKLYPDFDWYLGFHYTRKEAPYLPEKIGKREQRLQLFNFACPRLPQVGSHVGLYCSNINFNRLEYCKSFLGKHSSDILVFIIHKSSRHDNPNPPKINYL